MAETGYKKPLPYIHAETKAYWKAQKTVSCSSRNALGAVRIISIPGMSVRPVLQIMLIG